MAKYKNCVNYLHKSECLRLPLYTASISEEGFSPFENAKPASSPTKTAEMTGVKLNHQAAGLEETGRFADAFNLI